MVYQLAAPILIPLAAYFGVTIPYLEKLANSKGVDLSTHDYDPENLTSYDDLFPELAELNRIKTFKTYEDSFYQPKPVVEETDLSEIIVQSDKDDDEVIDVKEEDLEKITRKDVSPGGEPPDLDPDYERMLKELANLTIDELLRRVEDKAYHNLHNLYREEIEKRKKTEVQGLVFPKEKTDNNLRLHEMRLKKITEGKIDAYPGNPKNDRIVLQPPEGSNLPPITIGKITFEDWESKILSDRGQIMEDANWYAKIWDHFDVMAKGDKKIRETLTKAWLSGQQNETPSSALANVIYIYEQFKRGIPFDEVKGKGLPTADEAIKSIIYGKEITAGVGQKISDFIDAGYGNTTRAIMGHNSAGGSPFVVDVHTARDTGLVDPIYLNHLKRLGYVIPDGVQIDFGEGGVAGTKYENRSLWGQDLTRYLNEKNWMGKNDWTPTEIQAIGWMNLTRMYSGLGQGGDIESALNRNLRRIAMEVDPGEGSQWDIQFGDQYRSLPDDKKFKINELVTKKAIEFVNKLTGIDFSSNVHGTGGWELIQNPSTVQEAYMSKESAKEAAALLGLFTNQTEIWVNSTKELTKNPQNYSLFIIEEGSTDLRDSKTLTGLFERIINNDPIELFRGYQPIMVNGQPGIQIIIDKDTISKAIKEKRIKKAEVLPYIEEFSTNGLANATKDLDFAVKNYISETELEKLTNDWTKQKNGQSFINYISEKFKSIAEDTGRSNIDYFREQLTEFLFQLIQKESRPTKTITKDTVKKLTKKREGGIVEIPHFHYGGFINLNRL